MTVSVDILFTVYFKHAYFSDGNLNRLETILHKNSLTAMRNYGLFFKPFKNGFRVLYETSRAGKPRERATLLNEGLSLRFVLQLSDSSFYNYTALKADNIKERLFYFRNRPENDNGFLHAGAFASESELVTPDTTGEEFFTKPFAVVDMALTPALGEEFVIAFDKKASYWQYIVVSEHLKNLASPAILNINDQAVFSTPEKIALPNKSEALLFTSLNPIDLKETPAELFRLVENYESGTGRHKVIKKALPVPDVRAVSSGSGKNNGGSKIPYSEIFIY